MQQAEIFIIHNWEIVSLEIAKLNSVKETIPRGVKKVYHHELAQ